jgi:hypothetical protein
VEVRYQYLARGREVLALASAARTSYLAGPARGQREMHVLACAKNNLAARAGSLGYRIVLGFDGQLSIDWLGAVEWSAVDLLDCDLPPRGEAGEAARRLLQELLSAGPRPHEEIRQKARALRISATTLGRAKQDLAVEARCGERDGRCVWYWHLPESGARSLKASVPHTNRIKTPTKQGLVYPQFFRSVTAGPVPPGRRVGGIDFGLRQPFAAVWGVLDARDVLWLCGEIYERGQPLSALVKRLPADVDWYADPAGAREIHELACAGVQVTAGRNDRHAGFAAVSARLADGRLRVLAGTCQNLLTEAALYRHCDERKDRREKLTEGEDHALDALRYLVSKLAP